MRKIGRLKYYVEIQQAIETQAESGQINLTWDTVAYRWMNIEPLTGNEYFAASMTMADVTHKLTWRDDYELHPKDRIKYGETIYNIVNILGENILAKEEL